MKIVIFSDTYLPEINGVATSVYTLKEALISHGDKVLVITTNPFSNEVTNEEGIVRIPGINLKRLYGYRLGPLYNRTAAKIIKDFAPDIVHCNHDGPIGQFGFTIASFLNLPVVYTYHTMYEDYTYYVTRGVLFDRLAKGIVRVYTRIKSRQIQGLIAPSRKVMEYLRSIGIDDYISIVPTGIDLDRFKKGNVDQMKVMALRKELKIKDSTKVILSLGRIAKEKSIDVCLRGYAKYLLNNPDSDSLFLLVGKGPQSEELCKLADSLSLNEHFFFAGASTPSDVPLYYQLGNVFVSASVTETQGLTFMEAMAAHLIVLARYDDNLAGTINDKKNGFFFLDEEHFASLLPNILNLENEEKDRICQNADASLEPYSIDNFYKNAMEVYKRALRKAW